MRLILSVIMMFVLCAGVAQKTTRGKLRLRDDVRFENSVLINDTIVPAKGEIGLYGYEKSQQSSAESFFVTNSTGRDIMSMTFSISYFNLKGEKLHSRTETVKCDIPPTETRKVDIKSWDSQRLWYYHGSHARHNDFGNPYDIRIHIEYVVSPAILQNLPANF